MNNILSFIIKLCLLFYLNLFFLNYKIYSECNNCCCKEKNKENLNDNIKNEDDLKNNKCNNIYNKDDEENNSENDENNKYYLNSGYDIDLPLNILWANCNCAILSIIRLLISHKYFLDKILNKEICDFAKNESCNNLFYNVLDKNSDLFKEIIKCKKDYNVQLNQIFNIYFPDEKVTNPYRILLKFINTYFQENFLVKYIDKVVTKVGTKIITSEPIIDFYKKIQNSYDTNDYWAVYNGNSSNGIEKIKLEENLFKKQADNTIKKYELIGIIGICGNVKDTSITDTDFVSILPVFDKNKAKKGYVIYQFNKRSEIMSIDELNKIERFGSWENPRFHLLIYKNV